MPFLKVTSPHISRPNTAGDIMKTVLIACIPGVLALCFSFGIGSILNIVLASIFCVGFESLCLKLRKRSVTFYLNDFSALVTAFLLGIALPPCSPWWLVAVACFFAIVIAKQLYGGLGFNPFNPAMVGYVVVLISFPIEMSRWVSDISMAPGSNTYLSLAEALKWVFIGVDTSTIDAYTSATPLDILKQNKSLTIDALYQQDTAFVNGKWAGAGWEWVNISFLLGGAFLIYKKVFTWHAPVSMLLTIAVLASVFYDGGSSASKGSPMFHLLSGATMFAAFFIITDPVSSAVSVKGRLVFGAGVGLLVFIIRAWGNYPDAVAFAVLLMNFASPFIDYYTLPRTYGHKKSESGRIK